MLPPLRLQSTGKYDHHSSLFLLLVRALVTVLVRALVTLLVRALETVLVLVLVLVRIRVLVLVPVLVLILVLVLVPAQVLVHTHVVVKVAPTGQVLRRSLVDHGTPECCRGEEECCLSAAGWHLSHLDTMSNLRRV